VKKTILAAFSLFIISCTAPVVHKPVAERSVLSYDYTASLFEETFQKEYKEFYTNRTPAVLTREILLTMPVDAVFYPVPESVVYSLTFAEGNIASRKLVKTAPEPYLKQAEKVLSGLKPGDIAPAYVGNEAHYPVVYLVFQFTEGVR